MLKFLAKYFVFTFFIYLSALDKCDVVCDQAPAILKASFIQKRALPHLKKPLETSGVLVFIKNRGILWDIIKPFRKSILISSTGIEDVTLTAESSQYNTQFEMDQNYTDDNSEEPDQDKKKSSIDKNNGPYQMIIGKILIGVLEASIDFLNNVEGFQINTIQNNNKWIKKLKPIDETMKSALLEISIEGDQHISHVVILKQAGQFDEIFFTEHKTSTNIEDATFLSQFEKALFK